MLIPKVSADNEDMTFSPPPSPPPPPPPIPYATPAGYAPMDPMQLTPQQLQDVAAAQLRAKKIRRAVGVAKFDGWATGVFGGLTFLTSLLFFSPVGILLGAGMIVVSFVEFRAVGRLKQLDAAATKTLAWNQVFFGSLLLAYAIYSLWNSFHGQGAISAQIANEPELKSMVGDLGSLETGIGLLVYGTLAAVAIFGQGGTALYYLSRRKIVEAYVRETPPWIIQAQRAGLSV
jgi:hypothetical protein